MTVHPGRGFALKGAGHMGRAVLPGNGRAYMTGAEDLGVNVRERVYVVSWTHLRMTLLLAQRAKWWGFEILGQIEPPQ